jgi:hypothetical protein
MRQEPLDFDPSRRTGAVLAAHMFSNVFSPPAVFAAAGLAMAWLDRQGPVSLLWGALYGILASLLPVLFVVYLYKTGRVGDLHMSDPRERHLPYMIGLVGALLAWYLVMTHAQLPLLQNLIFCHFVVMLTLAGLNYYRLISAHVASLTAITVYSGVSLSLQVGLFILPLVGLTIYVRRFLKRHTAGELVTGVAAGVGAVLLMIGLGVLA